MAAGAKSVYVSGLPMDITKEALQEHFMQFGQVSDVRINYDRVTGKIRGYGFVDFLDKDNARKAVEASVTQMGINSLKISFATPKSKTILK